VKASEYRDLIAAYVHVNFASRGLVVYTEVSFGRSIIGKNRRIDVFVVRESRIALAIECKYQDVQGTTDEKIPYAIQDLEALRIPGCLCYAGEGWSEGVMHALRASKIAARCHPKAPALARTDDTKQLDHVIAATFELWDDEEILPPNRRFVVTSPRS